MGSTSNCGYLRDQPDRKDKSNSAFVGGSKKAEELREDLLYRLASFRGVAPEPALTLSTERFVDNKKEQKGTKNQSWIPFTLHN